MRILVIGAGIAGLSLGRMLQDRGMDVVLIEKATKFRHIGYIIAIWEIGRRILRTMGLEEQLLAMGHQTDHVRVLNKGGRFLKTWPLHKLGAFTLVDRADFHAMLVSAAKDVPIRFSTTVEQIEERGEGVMVTLSDGKREKFDVVVGADGMDSAIRTMVFGSYAIKDFGWEGAIFWLKPHPSFPSGTVEIWGDGRIFVFASHGKERICVYVGASRSHGAFHGKKGNEGLANIKHIFRDFAEPVPTALDHLEDPNAIYTFDMVDVPQHEWCKGHVALVGDAAHAMLPRSGVGASLALEDAFVLAEELAHADKRSIPDALQRYAARRAPRVRKMRHASLESWRWFAVQFNGTSLLRNVALKFIPMFLLLRRFRSAIREKL